MFELDRISPFGKEKEDKDEEERQEEGKGNEPFNRNKPRITQLVLFIKDYYLISRVIT